MFLQIKESFPKRPLKIKYHGIASPLFSLFFSLFFLLLAGGNFYISAPDIMRDRVIAQDYVELPDANITGSCRVDKYSFAKCDATISIADQVNKTNGRRGFKQYKISFSFFDPSKGNHSVTAIASRSNPDLVTVDLAVEKLSERTIALSIGMLIFIGVALYFLYRMFKQKGLLRKLKALSGKVLYPVSVTVVGTRKAVGIKTVTYSYLVSGKKQKVATMMRKQEPFFLSSASNDDSALGVTDEKGEVVLLLDEALTRLDFSDTERAALKAARG